MKLFQKRVSVSGAQSPTQEPTSPTFDSAASDGEELANMLPESGKSGAAASVSAADVPAKN
jgi:hypothetical protein